MAVALVACSSPKPMTAVTGTFAPGAQNTSAQIIVGEYLDTTIVAEDGQFFLEIPTDVTTVAYAVGDGRQIVFVADGTDITLDFDEGVATSSSKNGVHSRLQDFYTWSEDFIEKYQDEVLAEGLSDEEKAAITQKAEDGFNEHLISVLGKNRDNVLGLMCATSIDLEDDARMLELLNSLSPEIKENPEVQRRINAILTGVGEGDMFLDFEVLQNPEDPSSVARLSDYVGNGKYVLVDFWASWCGPCRREIPNIKAVYDEFHGADFDVLSVAVWDKPEDTMKALKEEDLPWSQIINAQRIPTDIYQIEGIPHIILFAPDGTIVKRNLRGSAIRAAVADALGK